MSFSLDDPALFQAAYLARAVALGGEHRGGVFTELRTAPFDVTGRGRELGNDSGYLERRAVLQPDLPDHVASQVVRVARDVDRKSTRLNSSHGYISYAVFCLKKKKL